MQDNEKKPALRFKGFTDPWEQRKISELAEKTYGGGTPTTSNEAFWNGNIPWIQSSDIVDGKLIGVEPRKYITQTGLNSSATQLVPKNSIAIITRVGVGKLAYMPFSYSTSQDFLSLSKLNTEPFFTVYACYKKLQSELNTVQGTSIKGITKDELLAKTISVPVYSEQKQIGSFFAQLDTLITLHQRKYEKLVNIKKSMLDKMFPPNGASVPEIRFKGFTDPWEQRKLGEIAKEVVRNDPASDAPIMMITAGNGFIEQSDRYAFNNAGESLKKYILLERGELAYNHGASKLRPYGSCFALTTVEKARIPFVYHCFSVEKSNPEFLSIELNGANVENQLRKIVSSGARMDGLLNIAYSEYTEVTVQLPKKEEQDWIAKFFKHLDTLITLHQRKYEKLVNIKKSMLDKMFPKNGASVPEIRFKGFTDPWEQRKLTNLCEKFTDGDWIEAKDQSDSGVRLVQTGNVGVTEYLDKPNNKKWISFETFEQLHCEEVYPGDILISRLPEPAGRACIMPNLGTKMITAVDCTIVRPNAVTSTRFLLQYLSSQAYFDAVNTCLAGGTRQRISRGNLAQFNVPIPSSKIEQEKIGEILEKLDTLITLHQRKLEKLQNIKKSCLEKMFV